jgi:hypothetical protein
LGSYTRALLVSQDRRHFFVTPTYTEKMDGRGGSEQKQGRWDQADRARYRTGTARRTGSGIGQARPGGPGQVKDKHGQADRARYKTGTAGRTGSITRQDRAGRTGSYCMKASGD